MKKLTKALALILCAVSVVCIPLLNKTGGAFAQNTGNQIFNENDYIKWVDFNAGNEIIKKVCNLDIKYHNSGTEFKTSEVLAYLALKNGNKFNEEKDSKNLNALINAVTKEDKKVGDFYAENKYYKYYVEAYSAIFDGIIGSYKEQDSEEIKYGIKAFFPFAKGFWFNHYDDFGNSRSYGYKRKHLGHDMMGSVGSPIISVEGGKIVELGWNQYGGWRVGVRSLDTKRYYYYAHLRKDKPFASDLKIGDTVSAGQVIGFLGNTGYSKKENTNLKSGKPHLHIGLQLIFDESQVKGSKEIWVDMYSLTEFLTKYRAAVSRNPDTKEYFSLSPKIAV